MTLIHDVMTVMVAIIMLKMRSKAPIHSKLNSLMLVVMTIGEDKSSHLFNDPGELNSHSDIYMKTPTLKTLPVGVDVKIKDWHHVLITNSLKI